MHFPTLLLSVLAITARLTTARFYPRSDADLDLADDDFEDDEHDLDDSYYSYHQQQPQQLYELFRDHSAQKHQQQDQSINTNNHLSQPSSQLHTIRPRTNAAYYQSKGIASSNQCKKVADCKCPNAKATNACISGKCSCGNANLEKIGNAFAKPILEGVKKIGDGLERVVNDTAWALKQALKIGSWLIPGVGKTAAKVLDAAIPQTKLKTGNVKADEVLDAISKVI